MNDEMTTDCHQKEREREKAQCTNGTKDTEMSQKDKRKQPDAYIKSVCV